MSVEIYYFYNIPGDSLYTDALLKDEQTPLGEVLAGINEFTAVLIVSDAGAARRRHNLDRVLATLEWLKKLRAVTSQIAWLNPMPKARWQDTSAEVIARYVDMSSMDADGLSDAVDVLRGLRPSVPK
ncbi:MAG: hypothetical protein MZV65_46040 [Chromatiales bacterium]|nr:hypothetical protein [Chromatiales bacterium]